MPHMLTSDGRLVIERTLMNHLDLKAWPDLPSTPSNPERTNVHHRLDHFRSNCRIHRE
jgi:hypothetical protein